MVCLVSFSPLALRTQDVEGATREKKTQHGEQVRGKTLLSQARMPEDKKHQKTKHVGQNMVQR